MLKARRGRILKRAFLKDDELFVLKPDEIGFFAGFSRVLLSHEGSSFLLSAIHSDCKIPVILITFKIVLHSYNQVMIKMQ